MTCKLKERCKQGETCVAHNGYDIWRCTAFKDKGVPMTNEEYLRSLNTEQLAEWLRGVYWHCHEIDCEHCNYPWRCMEKGDIVEWLEQPYKE